MIACRTTARKWALAFAIFAVVEFLLMQFADRPVSLYLRGIDATDKGFIDIFRAYTDLGKGFWYLWPSGIGFLVCLVLWRAKRLPEEKRADFLRAAQTFGFFFACVALSGLATDILKRIFGRARPVMLEREHFYGFHPFDVHYDYNSWPSGHATTAFAAGCALALLWPRGRYAFYACALALAASRVMVNAHYLSDAVAGAAVGIAAVFFVHGRFRRRGLPVNSHKLW